MANPQHHTAIAATATSEKPYSREEFTRWLTESCQRQDVPAVVTNPTVLAMVATLLR